MINRHQRNIYQWILSALIMLSLTAPSHAANPVAKFSEVIEKSNYTFKLQGTGYRRFLFMKAFDAAFYTTEGVSQEKILTDVPKYLEVEYHVGIPARSLADYTVTHMKLNISKEEFLSLKEQIVLMGEYFVDLKANDRFSLVYIPGIGTQFAHNGRLTGVIPGELFGRALFSVWIGDKPFDPNLKRKVLGLK